MNQPVTKSQDRIVVNATASNAAPYPVRGVVMRTDNNVRQQTEQVAKAVFAYLQARRALGDTDVNTADVAKALRVPQRLIDQAVRGMSNQGVKIR